MWALVALPLAVGAYLLAQRRRVRYPVLYPNLEVLASVVAPARWTRHVPPALLLAALGALLLGAARPHVPVLVPRDEATVVLTMDSSGSMRATDVSPSRVDAARVAAHTFVDQLPERFRVGVVSFDDVVDVLVRPTDDRELIHRAIDGVDADGGTAIGDAIARSLALEPRSRADARRSPGARPLAAIVLLSDGYNTAGQVDPLEAAEMARRRRLPVYTIALGTEEGVITAPAPDGTYLRRVPPDPDTLRAIARTTNGQFFEAPDEDELRAIYEDLGSRVGFKRRQREVTVAFVGAGLVLAAGAIVPALRRRSALV